MKLAGQVALVTGGSRGIGRATALAFAAEGADIAFCHLDDGAKAEETASEIRALGRRAMHRSLDVVDIAASRAFAQEAAAAFGPIDILFNNAGMNIRKKFEDYTEADYDRILDVHMKGMFFMAQAVYPAMAARGRGCIINIASQRGLKGAVNSTPVLRGEGGDHRLHPRAGLRGDAEGRAGQRDCAGADRHRPDRDDGAGRPPGVHRRAAGASVRPPRGDCRDRIAAGGTGWRVLCRRDAVTERRGRHVPKPGG